MKKIVSISLIVLFIAGLLVGLYFLFGPILNPSFHHARVTNTIKIDSDDDFTKLSFPGSGTAENPYVLENYVFGANESFIKKWYIGLEIINTTKHFIVRSCEFYGGLHSLRITNVAKGTAKIIGNTFYAINQAEWDNFKGYSGIEILKSDDVLIKDNLFSVASKYEQGGCINIYNTENLAFIENMIIFHETESVLYIYDSNNVSVKDNYVEAISFCYIENLTDSSIVDNICFMHGTVLYTISSSNINIQNNSFETAVWGSGIIIKDCSYISITNNNISKPVYDIDDHGVGIFLANCNFSLISYNVIKYFANYGIQLMEGSSNNTIYHNMFYNNTGSDGFHSQGFDEGLGNDWYNPIILEGNYWNDLGMNSTYPIAGPAGSIDLYPLSSPIYLHTY